MVDLDERAPRSSACLDDDRALALVDGQLSVEAREEIEAHLDVCASCRRFVSELAKESLFASPVEAPTDLERTGYAPGRSNLLEPSPPPHEAAITRIGVPDAIDTAPIERTRSVWPRHGPRHEAPRRARASPARKKAASSKTAPGGLRALVVLSFGVVLALLLLAAVAGLISLGVLAYAMLRT
ncbi:MAG: zf-HC2 domain-containing protein [Sandaracinaceae bacterium]|nr:zf-HC2 domain-containing protein [Sandaracinaceae bacterium]